MKNYYGPEYTDIPNTSRPVDGADLEAPANKNSGVWALITFLMLLAVVIAFVGAAFFAVKTIKNASAANAPAESYDLSAEDFEEELEEAIEEDLFTTGEEYDISYEFANANSIDNGIEVYPNGTVNDDTVIKGKRLGDFVDYIENEVLEDGYYLNKSLLYEMISVEIIDPSLYDSQSNLYFEQTMAYCLAMADHFMDTDVKINSCTLDYTDTNVQKFNVTCFDTEDTWVIDYSNDKFYMKDGKSEYSSTMLDRENTIPTWMVVTDIFFELGEAE